MPTKNYVFFSAASCKKDIIFGGHLKQTLAFLISLGLYDNRYIHGVKLHSLIFAI